MWSLTREKMRAIGHRGCRGPHQENSLQAIQWAFDNGAWAVEVDVWLVDGELALIHDRRAQAYLGATGFVKNVPMAKLREVMEVPTLSDALHFIPANKAINVEIKDSDALEGCLNLVKRYVELGHIRWDQVLFSSFDHRILAELKQRNKRAHIAPLFADIPLQICGYASRLGAVAINMDVNCLDRETVEQAHAHGLAVYVYTVDCAIDVDMLTDWGVDGIFVDDVAWYMGYRHDQ